MFAFERGERLFVGLVLAGLGFLRFLDEIELIEKPAPAGGTERRCPDIGKLAKLGYAPKVPLAQGLGPTVDWYWANEHLAPKH